MLLVLLCQVSVAHESAKGKVMATTGPFIYRTKVSGDIGDENSPILGGFGLLAEGGVDRNGGVELGMTYLHKMYLRESEGHLITEKIKRMQMSVGYRHWFNSYFSAGLSYYTSYSMGDPHVIHNDFPGEPIYTTAHKIAEKGFEFSFIYEVWRNDKFAIVTDFNYSHSLSARRGEEANVAGILIGYKQQIHTK